MLCGWSCCHCRNEACTEFLEHDLIKGCAKVAPLGRNLSSIFCGAAGLNLQAVAPAEHGAALQI